MSSSQPSYLPPATVLLAFSCDSSTQPLLGGQNQCRLANSSSALIVLKPIHPGAIAESESLAYLLAQLPSNPAFRIPRPIPTSSGSYTHDFWIATEFLPGYRTGPRGKWTQILSASRSFHNALKGASKPTWLSGRTHAWAVADRVAWEEESLQHDVYAHTETSTKGRDLNKTLEHLVHLRGAIEGCTDQLVHGDLSGNVMFAGEGEVRASDSKPPAIIDFSPFWRPVEYAEAIMAADGMLWFGEGRELVELVGKGQMRLQMLVRALIFRLAASCILNAEKRVKPDEKEVTKFQEAVDLVGKLFKEKDECP